MNTLLLALAALLLAAAAAAWATAPLWRRRQPAAARAAHEVSDLKRQLAELEREAERAGLSGPELEAARRDLGRKLLRAADAHAREADIGLAPLGAVRPSLIAAAAVLVLGGATAYVGLGRPDLPGVPFAARDLAAERTALRPTQAEAERVVAQASPPAPPVDPRLAAVITQAEAQLATSPTDVELRIRLAEAYFQVERTAEAWPLFAQARALLGDAAPPELAVRQGQAMAVAAGGIISQEAEAVFRAAPHAPMSLYFLGLAAEQAHDDEGALSRWAALYRAAPTAPYAEQLLRDIARISGRMNLDGERVVANLRAQAGVASAPDARGPTFGDVAAAAGMSAEERREMINSMVAGLAERLEDNPDDLEGWLRLIRSYMVLERRDDAQAAMVRARDIFKDDPAGRALLAELTLELELDE